MPMGINKSTMELLNLLQEIYQIRQTNFWRFKMANGWTGERKQKQRELIQNWKPWEKSTGARTTKGKAKSKMNAYKFGSSEAKMMLRELGRMLREEKKLID